MLVLGIAERDDSLTLYHVNDFIMTGGPGEGGKPPGFPTGFNPSDRLHDS